MSMTMEIEAKYQVPDSRQFERLLALDALGSYIFLLKPDLQVEDRYYDTPQWSLYQQGYVCRVRQQAGEWVIALKGLGGAEGAIHRREEYEQMIPPNTPLNALPNGPVQRLLVPMAQIALLREICRVQQVRSRRNIQQERRRVGELSLDSGQMVAGSQRRTFLEVEVELADEGKLSDLDVLGALLRGMGLIPEVRSKFERARELIQGLQ